MILLILLLFNQTDLIDNITRTQRMMGVNKLLITLYCLMYKNMNIKTASFYMLLFICYKCLIL